MTTRNTARSTFQKRIVGRQLPCLFLQHDGNTVTNRIGEPVQTANQNMRVTLVFERSLAYGTSQDLEQARIHLDLTSDTRVRNLPYAERARASHGPAPRQRKPRWARATIAGW